ncbi:MAG: hypothetical protein M3O46_08160 [Myxococcota bacterium]|nr:hypothetical protein [Myxococcota bacterium]
MRCDDGLLETEYVLFGPADIVLRAADPVTVRETGYITTVRDALARLASAGVTPELADEAARAMSAELVTSFARSAAVAAVASRLGACELFDGAVYRASDKTYEGAWLDLRSLAAALPGRVGSAALQALHLAAALSEVARSTPLHLSTVNATRDRRPGERTHRRVTFEGMRDLPNVLRNLAPNLHRVEFDAQGDRVVRDALLARVRERATGDGGPQLREHLARLESALAVAETRSSGPLTDPELWQIEQQLAAGDAHGVRQRLDELERVRGSTAALRYLRARAALVGGDAPPSSVAQALTVIANDDRSFHEAELVAARAWLAAGEEAYARHFARRIVEDVTARESERVMALEILEATSATMRSQVPPPVSPGVEAYVSPSNVDNSMLVEDLPSRDFPIIRSPRRGASLPPLATIPPPVRAHDVPPPGEPSEIGARVQPNDRAADNRAAPRVRYDPELVEALALPLGASEDVLAVGDWPTSPIQARTAMTRLARSLARDYRLWYGTTLRCDVLAIDGMQRHLTQRYQGAPLDDPKIALELQRHGALLSEILARAVGADWVDIAPTEPGYWAMLVPPSTRCWPIGRVYRFVSLGHTERDLVDYYLDIESRTRR